jgi:uncharacterized lipoprotein YajG
MKYLALCLLLAGCAAPIAKTHHTAAITAPSAAPIKAANEKAHASNTSALAKANTVEGKAILVLKWLRAHQAPTP